MYSFTSRLTLKGKKILSLSRVCANSVDSEVPICGGALYTGTCRMSGE